jgi:heme A synthase
MNPIPPFGPVATAGAPLASTIVVIDVPLVVALVLILGVLATVLAVGTLHARRRRRRVSAGSLARGPQVAAPYAALGGER